MRNRCLTVFMLMVCVTLTAVADVRTATWKALTSVVESYQEAAPASAFRRGLAILPVRIEGGEVPSAAAETISAYLKEKLAASTVFLLVERANLSAILSEIELGLTGMVDPSTAALAGDLTGAEILLQGSLSEAGDSLLLSLELVDVATATIAAAATASLDRSELVRETDAYIRSSFQSQYGLAVEVSGGMVIPLAQAWVRDIRTGEPRASIPQVSAVGLNVAYRLLPWLDLNGGVLNLSASQFYLSEDGRVQSPLSAERSIRYTTFQATGPSAGVTAVLSPLPRLNLQLGGDAVMFVDSAFTHWFMDFACYDIIGDGTVAIVKRDIEVEGSVFDVVFAGLARAKAEILISRRLSVGLDLRWLFMAPYRPDRYRIGNLVQASSTADSYPTYQDKNGQFDFMGDFNIARLDGTTDSDLLSFDFSGLSLALVAAIHF